MFVPDILLQFLLHIISTDKYNPVRSVPQTHINTCQWIVCYFSGLVVLETVKDRSIFRCKVSDHAHRCAGLSADKDVGHVGKCPRSRTLGAVLPPSRDHDVREHGI